MGRPERADLPQESWDCIPGTWGLPPLHLADLSIGICDKRPWNEWSLRYPAVVLCF